MAVLRLDRVSRIHGSGHVQVDALVDVSLSVEAGELVAVMGPSGSGKTTLLSLAGGLDLPTAGSVLVDGSDLATLNRAELARLRRHSVGYVFQQFNLIPGLTAAENVSLPLELDGVNRKEAYGAAVDALARLEMAGLENRFPDDLSGGEQQRVAIARAIIGDRRLLLADEPTGALDSMTGETVLRLMRRHCDNGGAAVLVTHDARFAAWADRIVFLHDGRVVDEAMASTPESLLADGTAL
ncbi:MAG: ABC transporter ATP-binding protein [Acidimicrobiia bacterium]|nr:ABC transporter ATP-binding protein [Acidimicrobiia bacterium]